MTRWLASLGLSLVVLSLLPFQVSAQTGVTVGTAEALLDAKAADGSSPVATLFPRTGAYVTAIGGSGDPGRPPVNAGGRSAQGSIAYSLRQRGMGAVPLFFGFGLLLAFTPCVFPMVPILSGLIAGQGTEITRRQGFTLSLTYVLAMAVTYTVAGVLAAFLGQDIHVFFQSTWLLIAFSAIFVVLALSMFGLYDLQLPARWQERLAELSNRQRGGSYIGVAIMGVLSALIIGPCVAPPLVGVLAVIAATGDVVLGATALFVMSLGMGAPLLLVGASAGHFLPKAGMWMDRVKVVFGVLLLGVAIWILERILPDPVSMLLWAILLVLFAVYMGATDSLGRCATARKVLAKGFGIVILSYGILLLVGVAAGTGDPLHPLRHVHLVTSRIAGQQPTASTAVARADIGVVQFEKRHSLWSDRVPAVDGASR